MTIIIDNQLQSSIVIQVALLLCLHLHYSFNVIFMFKVRSSSSQSLHTCLYTHGFQHSTVKIVSWTSWIIKKVPNSTKLISLWFIFLEWILRICDLDSSLGRGNSIFLSNLPDLIKAGSSTSGLLVAQITLMSSLGENLHKIWLTRQDGSKVQA